MDFIPNAEHRWPAGSVTISPGGDDRTRRRSAAAAGPRRGSPCKAAAEATVHAQYHEEGSGSAAQQIRLAEA